MVIAVCHNFPPKNEASIFDLDNLVQFDRSGFRLAFVHPKIFPRRFTQGRQYFFFKFVLLRFRPKVHHFGFDFDSTHTHAFPTFRHTPASCVHKSSFWSALALPSTHMQNSLGGRKGRKVRRRQSFPTQTTNLQIRSFETLRQIKEGKRERGEITFANCKTR